MIVMVMGSMVFSFADWRGLLAGEGSGGGRDLTQEAAQV